MDLTMALELLGGGVLVLGTAWGVIRTFEGLRDRILILERDSPSGVELRRHVDELADRMAKQETKMEVFWTAVLDMGVRVLHSPEHLERDALLERLKARTISKPEARILRDMLVHDFNGNPNTPHGFVYMLFVARCNEILEGDA